MKPRRTCPSFRTRARSIAVLSDVPVTLFFPDVRDVPEVDCLAQERSGRSEEREGKRQG